METLHPASHTFNSNWLMQECNSTIWTREENKKFESALAIFDKETPDRWIMVAAMIPGKSVLDVLEQYKELVSDISDIEAGRVPVPGYLASSFSLKLVKDREINAFRKRSLAWRTSDHEKKKGVPWTEDEHRRFLRGLQKLGKGDWMNISRNYVITKTSTQVASHAQKYYLRQLAEGKEKRRPSIHDITMVHMTDATQSDDSRFTTNSKSSAIPLQQKSISTPKISLDWNHLDDGSIMVFNSKRNNPFMAYTREIASRGHTLQKVGGHGADQGPLHLGYPFNPTRYQVW